MKVIGLLNEIYNGNYDRLPNKIKVDGKEFIKKDLNYHSTANNRTLLEVLEDCTWNLSNLSFKVEEAKEVKEEKWKPKYGDTYSYMDINGNIFHDIWYDTEEDYFKYNMGNATKTDKELRQHLENIKTEIELKELAEKLNKGEKIDWNNKYQDKNYLVFDYDDEKIKQAWSNVLKRSRTIYCLSEGFKDEAIKQIGKERISNYLKEKF